jgi:hypothetical protein
MVCGLCTCRATRPSFSRPSIFGPFWMRRWPTGIATLSDLESAVAERCRVLKDDPGQLGANFHWWPEPVTPT